MVKPPGLLDSTPSILSADLRGVFRALAICMGQEERTRLSTAEGRDYAKEPLLGRNQNPYSWWQADGCYKLPPLAQASLEYLAVPATSVPSERIFLTTEAAVSTRREHLLEQNMEYLTSLYDNL